ncbi:MAG TPA: hypothetical protein VHL34_09975 [Rhizomicrobium sp.]|jgi:hypothetical protein|nr:hypothetical protein [Rhizomicrobium sp.]
MFGKRLRALATALVLGSACVAVAGISTIVPAEAAVRPAVGKPLKEAQSLAASGNYSAANAKVREAESVGGLTGEERGIISQMKQYIAVKSGSGALGGKAKFANDYRAGRYSAVIADGEELRKSGALDAQSMRVVAQAYYQMHNYSGCLSYIKRNLGYGGASQLALACASGAGDAEAMRDLLKEVVMSAPTPDNWKRLIQSAEGTKGLGDHETLDLYRLKKLTGTLNGVNDYALLAQLGIQFGASAEAYGVTKAAFDAKIMQGDRWTRLLNLAKTQMDKTNATFAQALAAAKADKRGENLLKLGEFQIGNGKAADAVGIIQQALTKQLNDPGSAKLRLGYAQLMAGQKDAAIRTFNSVRDTPQEQSIAQIWVIYAKTAK